MFSGFRFKSVSGMYGKQDFGGGWRHEATTSHVLMHLKRVSKSCGTCFTAKFARTSVVENLSPARIDIYPTGQPDSVSTTLFFHAGIGNESFSSEIGSSLLHNQITLIEWQEWNPLPGIIQMYTNHHSVQLLFSCLLFTTKQTLYYKQFTVLF